MKNSGTKSPGSVGRKPNKDRRLVVLLSEREEAMLHKYCERKGIKCGAFARTVIVNEVWRLLGEENPTIF